MSILLEAYGESGEADRNEPNKNKVGTVTKKQVEDIAKLKMPDLNESAEAAFKTVAGTARSMGIDVVG